MRHKVPFSCGGRWLLAAVAAAALWAGVEAGATSLRPLALDELVGGASDVHHGRVAAIESRFNDDQTLILTEVRLAVTETLKGRSRAEVVLVIPGGRVGDLLLEVVGAPSFAVGEEVLVFGRRGDDGRLFLPDLYQDKYRLELEADGSRWLRGQHPPEKLLPAAPLVADAAGRLAWESFREHLMAVIRQGGGR